MLKCVCMCVCVLGDGTEFQKMCHTNLPQPSTVSYLEKMFDVINVDHTMLLPSYNEGWKSDLSVRARLLCGSCHRFM